MSQLNCPKLRLGGSAVRLEEPLSIKKFKTRRSGNSLLILMFTFLKITQNCIQKLLSYRACSHVCWNHLKRIKPRVVTIFESLKHQKSMKITFQPASHPMRPHNHFMQRKDNIDCKAAEVDQATSFFAITQNITVDKFSLHIGLCDYTAHICLQGGNLTAEVTISSNMGNTLPLYVAIDRSLCLPASYLRIYVNVFICYVMLCSGNRKRLRTRNLG